MVDDDDIGVPGRRSAVPITVRDRLSEDAVVKIGMLVGLQGPGSRLQLARGMCAVWLGRPSDRTR